MERKALPPLLESGEILGVKHVNDPSFLGAAT